MIFMFSYILILDSNDMLNIDRVFHLVTKLEILWVSMYQSYVKYFPFIIHCKNLVYCHICNLRRIGNLKGKCKSSAFMTNKNVAGFWIPEMFIISNELLDLNWYSIYSFRACLIRILTFSNSIFYGHF